MLSSYVSRKYANKHFKLKRIPKSSTSYIYIPVAIIFSPDNNESSPDVLSLFSNA